MKKISDAKQDLEEGRAKAAKDIADGEDKIADGEKKIDDIPEAEWYIYDRSTLPEYNGYWENADRMKALFSAAPIPPAAAPVQRIALLSLYPDSHKWIHHYHTYL